MIRIGRLLGLAALISLYGGSAMAEAVRWTVDPARSAIRLEVQALGTTQAGRFEDWTGDIVFDPAQPQYARVNLAIRSASLRMGDAFVTDEAKGAGFLDAQGHPRIDVRLTGLERLSDGRYRARADVTCKGRTRPVSFPVSVNIAGREARIEGVVSLDREDFGIGTDGLFGLAIGRMVKVDVGITARTQP